MVQRRWLVQAEPRMIAAASLHDAYTRYRAALLQHEIALVTGAYCDVLYRMSASEGQQLLARQYDEEQSHGA